MFAEFLCNRYVGAGGEASPDAAGLLPGVVVRKHLVGTESLDTRMRDEIDDQVAEAFDAYLADRLAEPGPLRASVTRGRTALVVLGTVGLGALATAVTPGGGAGTGWIWGAIALIDVVWLLTARRR
ncbi:hypothetical protein [Streptomyces sp. NPDC058382]|uniref:hypothetical protein n=1 Tax=unclassified Streptomyces TaxID=2593676 RepID=UPI00364218FE